MLKLILVSLIYEKSRLVYKQGGFFRRYFIRYLQACLMCYKKLHRGFTFVDPELYKVHALAQLA
jgi:hypothetical protein